MNKANFGYRTLLVVTALSSLWFNLPDSSAAEQGTLFPLDTPGCQWIQFPAAGFAGPVSGVVYRTAEPPCCGVPLGGIDTGCLDVDARGVWGFLSIFHPESPSPRAPGWRIPRKLIPDTQPILGLSTGGKTWVLAAKEFIDGNSVPWCTEPDFLGILNQTIYTLYKVAPVRIPNVAPARQINYWGHYPVADMEFETDAPVTVGMRAWAPFLPGAAAVSNTPAAVFEVHLRNPSNAVQKGTLAFNFPGPDAQEAKAVEFARQKIHEDFDGVLVSSPAGVSYLLGVIGKEDARFGAGLSRNPAAWSKIADELPQPPFREDAAVRRYQDASASAAVDFTLNPGENKTVRFLLTWYVPVWEGNRKTKLPSLAGSWHHYRWIGSEWEGDTHYFTHMYAARYNSAVDVARRITAEHQSLLQRVLAWQQVVYADPNLPVWLRDSLINNLCLIAEDSHWAQAKAPLGDWAFPSGLFALNESPRGCPDLACIPCDWYGNIPIVYFFPDLARTTLRAFKAYQKDSGEPPFLFGIVGDLPEMACPGYDWQISLNGVCYVDLADRLWRRTGDNAVLAEFYDSLKKSNTWTMSLSSKPGAVIRMPDSGGMEWFEFGEWAGMATHMGGLRLASLLMMERMAEAMGDTEYAQRCRDWFADGSRAMEEQLWAGSYYLNFWEPETGKKSTDIMAYQLDGEWAAVSHGLPGVFQSDRVKTTLETIKKYSVAQTPDIGAPNFVHADGSVLSAKDKVAAYGPYAMFSAEVVVLGMTYMSAGQRDFGLDLVRKHWENLVCRQRHPWDMPNMVRGDDGKRLFGTDYYQCMMLWGLPAMIVQQDLTGPCKNDGLVQRIITAAATK